MWAVLFLRVNYLNGAAGGVKDLGANRRQEVSDSSLPLRMTETETE